jgi:hypothetical protein
MHKKTKYEPHEHLFKIIREYNPSATDSSVKVYAQNIEKIYKDLGEPSGSFDLAILKDYGKVIDTFDKKEYSKNTYKNKLSSIITFLLASGVDKKIVGKYSDKVDMLSAKIDREKHKMEWTDKEKDNILTIDQLKEYLETMENKLPKKIETFKDIHSYQLYLCGAFHLEFPLRNELADTQIYYINEYNKIKHDEEVNYFVINNKKNTMECILNNYKTKKTNGVITFTVDDHELVKLFIKYYEASKKYFEDVQYDHWLLYDSKGKKLSRNDYTRFLNRVFDGTGNTISSSLIRKIVLSSIYPVDKIKKMSHIMGHSIKTEINDYVRS